MAPKTTLEKARLWALRAGLLGVIGFGLGALLGFVMALSESTLEGRASVFFFIACFAGVTLASVPLAIAAWFVLLRMIEQVADAAKGSRRD